jgi:hypothetical protein
LVETAKALMELVKCLDSNEAAAQEARRKSLEDVKKSLQEQVTHPKNNALRMDGPLNLNACGPSSVQCMSGEDREYDKRKKAQQEQVQYWCAEDMLEKRRALEEEQRREREYAEYVIEQDRIRAELEEAAAREKEAEARMRQSENMEYARLARERKQQEIENKKHAVACPILTEDTKLATNVNAPHRIRPDHFKGYDKDTIRQIYQENDAVVEEKQEISRAEANAEKDWAMYHAEMLRQMEQSEQQKQQRIEEENRVQRETLQQQKEMLQQRKEDMEKSKLPAIGTEFFQRFGTSCR